MKNAEVTSGDDTDFSQAPCYRSSRNCTLWRTTDFRAESFSGGDADR